MLYNYRSRMEPVKGAQVDFYERLSMRGVLWACLHDLHGNAFQDFFQDMMTLCVPGFVDVRTHGNLGDRASDGLDLHDARLYACYAPETVDPVATIRKFRSDLAGAVKKRSGQFTTFVFVHNDVRGLHPELSVELAKARSAYPSISFEVMGFRHFRDMLGQQNSQDVEAVLKTQLPMQHTIAVGLQEMEELLADLATKRISDAAQVPIETVSAHKLLYSDLTRDTQAEPTQWYAILCNDLRLLPTSYRHHRAGRSCGPVPYGVPRCGRQRPRSRRCTAADERIPSR